MKKSQKIYVVCPPNVKTGGTELLHQLVKTLNDIGLEAYIVYTGVQDKIKIPFEFQGYISSYLLFSQIEDNENNIVIFSEVQVELIETIKFTPIIIWWLSVDNYLVRFNLKKIISDKNWKALVKYFFLRRWRFEIKSLKNRIHTNLAQSYYAMDFMKKNGVDNIYYLSDYINQEYLSSINESSKKDIVLYNPKKGWEYTKRLIECSKDLKWKPLINMSNKEVKEALSSSKVYVDFGNHPGKDRFPREAVICGCCIITGKKGSAGYYEDVPINEKYKFDDTQENISGILQEIRYCLDNYERVKKDFDDYRNFVRSEPKRFREDVCKIFKQ